MSATTAADERLVLIKRTFRAPRELVFEAWSSAEHLSRWYAPNGCTTTFESLDFRVGGEYLSCVHIPDGKKCWCRGVYREIDEPKRIAFTSAICDAEGRLLGPTDVGMDPDWPRETTVTVTFEEADGGTLLTLHQTVSESLAKRTGAHPSWLQMLDRLEADLGRQ